LSSAYSPSAAARPFSDVHRSAGEPPQGVVLDLKEALNLLAALEDSRDVLVDTDHLAVLSQVEHQIQILGRRLGLHQGGSDVY
jgi:hypothetical protein